MGFLDSLIGRTKLPKSNEDKIFAIGTAAVGLEASASLSPAGRVGVVFKSLPPGRFDQLIQDTVQMLQIKDSTSPDDPLKVKDVRDELGYEWLIVDGDDFDGLVAALHGVALGLEEEGLGGCLLAAVFPFLQRDRRVYFIYGYKQGTFYPFVPSGDRQRDNAAELDLATRAKEDLPIEPNLSSWFPLWGVPV
ncbi:MAG: PspA-associated protein PspAB [Candidatus Dormibacteria bacterium]